MTCSAAAATYTGSHACPAPSTSGLPYTGFEAWMLPLVGIAILVAGAISRRLGRTA